MKLLIFTFSLLSSSILLAQTKTVHLTIEAEEIPEYTGKVIFYSLPDSSMIKGSYIDSSFHTATFSAKLGDSMYVSIKAPNYTTVEKAFKITDDITDIGTIKLQKDLELEEVEASYSKPVFERTMDGISVNVKGTTLEQLNTLFDILKASPRLTSPDDESIEIIGVGTPLILVDRQPILSNDELKAIPADQVDRVEIITSPSAKYRAQKSSGGVIEVFTNNFSLEGYRASINLNGGVSTQLQPLGRSNLGISFKKKKFSLNSYLGINYNSSLRNGETTGLSNDNTFGFNTEYENRHQFMWQYYNLKMAYEINSEQKVTLGVNGNGSASEGRTTSNSKYHSNDSITLLESSESKSRYTWFRNTAFINYTWEVDTFGSNFEVNLNYLNRINDDNSTNLSTITNYANNSQTGFNTQVVSNDRPNIGELRINYEHNFDTTRWRLSVGGSYSLLLNGKVFGRNNLVNSQWVNDPIYTNSYDYREDIGALYAEVSKKWDKFGFKAGIRGEYTRLDGYSKSLQKQFMDSSFILPFPNASILIEPNDTFALKLYYNSGIYRPEFDNYDPFVRIEDSLSVNYGNPFLRPEIEHTIGLELDLFQAYNLSVSYSVIDNPISSISFVNDSTFVSESTPWNAKKEETLSASLSLPVELNWLSGWNSFWLDYSKYQFSDIFNRDPFFNLTYGFYSHITFKLPKDFAIMNRINLFKWGSDEMKTKPNFDWGIRLTKKFLDGDMRLFVEASNIFPTKNRYERTAANFVTTTRVQNNFTSFRVGWFYKFGRLKASTNIQESSSGQSDRL